MKKNHTIFNNGQLLGAKMEIEEVIELIKTSKDLFHKKLKNLKENVIDETNEDKKNIFLIEIKKLHREYNESLQILEIYMDRTFEEVQLHITR